MNVIKWFQRTSELIDPFVQRYGSPDSVKKFFVYSYHYIDFHDYTKPAQEVLEHWSRCEDFISALKELWLAHGWDGDGVVTSIWLPPFLIEDLNDEAGHIIWHVKQLEDGTSWLASDKSVSQIERYRVSTEAPDNQNQTEPPGNCGPHLKDSQQDAARKPDIISTILF